MSDRLSAELLYYLQAWNDACATDGADAQAREIRPIRHGRGSRSAGPGDRADPDVLVRRIVSDGIRGSDGTGLDGMPA